MAEQPAGSKKPYDAADTGDEIHLLDLVFVLVRQKKLVIGTPIVIGAVALLATLLMEPSFTSTATIMPPQQQQSSGFSAMLGQLGGLAGSAAGIKSPNDLYLGLLESRTVADNLIVRFKLKERYQKTTMDETRAALKNQREIGTGKTDGLISIAAHDKDPQFAADLANAHVDELARLTQTMALTEASQRRTFFEKQMKDAKDQLADAEIGLRNTQERTGMIQPDAQVQDIIATVSQLRAVIAAKEVELNSMRTFATGKNPDLLRGQEELRSLKLQLAKMDRHLPLKDGQSLTTTGEIPKVGTEYVRSVRDVKYYETMFEFLSKQFELAKIDEAKDSSLIQLLDKAIPAERKSKPNRTLLVAAAIIAGGILGILLAFLREGYWRARQNPETRKRWNELSLASKRA